MPIEAEGTKLLTLTIGDNDAPTAQWASIVQNTNAILTADPTVLKVNPLYSAPTADKRQVAWFMTVNEPGLRNLLLMLSAKLEEMGVWYYTQYVVADSILPLPMIVSEALWGLDCPLQVLDVNVSVYAGLGYMRDFGVNGQTWTPVTGQRPTVAAQNSILLHYSWKTWDRNAFDARLAAQLPECDLTFYHEPMGDIDPAEYRRIGAEMTLAINTHPNKNTVQNHGPILTRYWLDEAHGNPNDFWYPGATAFYFDAYSDSWTGAGYPDPEWMLASGIAVARAYGVPFGVPELGGARRTDDPDGTGRANWIRDMVSYLQLQPDLIGVAWWQNGRCALPAGSPEEMAWKDAIDDA